MAGKRASIFEEPEDLDISEFAPKTLPHPSPSQELVRQVSEAARFRSREPGVTESSIPSPRRSPRRYRTGRSVQFNVKASQKTIDEFYAVSDRNGWVLGETLEHALAALLREMKRGGEEAL